MRNQKTGYPAYQFEDYSLARGLSLLLLRGGQAGRRVVADQIEPSLYGGATPAEQRLRFGDVVDGDLLPMRNMDQCV